MNITPLMDVIFILLIFFMITTQFRSVAMPLDLPRGENSQQERSEAVVIAADSDGHLELEGRSIELDELQESLAALLREDRELAVTFAGDKNINFDLVVQILGEIKAAGVEHVGIRHEAASL